MMPINWQVLATIAAPVITLLLGVWINRKFENRPVLFSYYGHVAAFRYTPPGAQPIPVHTHSVVLRNAGRRSATNVRLHHNVLPDFTIWPGIQHSQETLPDGSRDIVIPTIVPGQQVTISYLYFPPVVFDQINAGIRSDEGFARQTPVLLQRQYPRWLYLSIFTLAAVGSVAIMYLLYNMASVFLQSR